MASAKASFQGPKSSISGVGRKARGQGCNHGALDLRQIAQSRGGGQRRPRFFQRSDPLVGLEYLPFLVVVWPDSMGEAPIGHAGTRVCGNRFAKTFGRFFVIKPNSQFRPRSNHVCASGDEVWIGRE